MSKIKHSLGLLGRVTVEIKKKDGSVERKEWGENVITNTGLAAWVGRAGDVGSVSAFEYLALGTSSTAEAPTQTQLTNELTDSGLSRSIATVTRTTEVVTNDTLRLEKTWTATATTTVREVGVFNAASSGLMCARKVINTPVQATEEIRVIYEIVLVRVDES
jgi:hypothetical protein